MLLCKLYLWFLTISIFHGGSSANIYQETAKPVVRSYLVDCHRLVGLLLSHFASCVNCIFHKALIQFGGWLRLDVDKRNKCTTYLL